MASMRPSPMLAQYATPLHGLYLCGAGTHPGGGVMAASGHNAAQRILKTASGPGCASGSAGRAIGRRKPLAQPLPRTTVVNVGAAIFEFSLPL